MNSIEIVLALLLAVAIIAASARFLPLPLPLLLIGGGVALSLLPALASVRLDPEVFFLLFIPPLLFSDAWLIPKRDLVKVLRPVLLLAFGLVFATVVVVGFAMHALIPSLPLAAAFALGAIVSPTDAVATSAMTGSLKLPRRTSLILSGESLINDASGLVAFKFAVAALATGAFSLGQASVELLLIAAGGFAIGTAVGWAAGVLSVGVKRAANDEPTIQTALSLLTPFAAYLAGEAVGASGVLSVVAAGLYAGWHDTRHVSPRTRLHAIEVWTMVIFAFNGFAFLLLGLTLRPALTQLSRVGSWPHLTLYVVVLWAVVTGIRLFWAFPAAYLPRMLSARVRAKEGEAAPKYVFITGWAGLRGSVTLAAALSLPAVAATGDAFPERPLLIFLAATTILLTLCINGLSLPWLIRTLHIHGDGKAERERRAAEIAVAQAGTLALDAEIARTPKGVDDSFARAMRARYATRVQRLTANAERRRAFERDAAHQRSVMLAAIAAERLELATLLETGVINDEVAREIEGRIDHAEMLAGDDGLAMGGSAAGSADATGDATNTGGHEA
jgi:CPA1 family monovalent cation:H+ antiporter